MRACVGVQQEMDGQPVHSTASVTTRNQQLPWLKLAAIFSAGILRNLGMVRLYNNITSFHHFFATHALALGVRIILNLSESIVLKFSLLKDRVACTYMKRNCMIEYN